MTLKRFFENYLIINVLYCMVGAFVLCYRDNELNGLSFVFFCAAPCTVGFMILDHFFSPIVIARFADRHKAVRTQFFFKVVLVFILSSILTFGIMVGRCLFHIPYEEGGTLKLFSTYVRIIIASIQLALLGKVISYSNCRYFDKWGDLIAFAICLLELDWLFRMARYSLPFVPKIIFGWAIIEHSLCGYVGAVLISVLMVIVLRWEIGRKELIT